MIGCPFLRCSEEVAGKWQGREAIRYLLRGIPGIAADEI